MQHIHHHITSKLILLLAAALLSTGALCADALGAASPRAAAHQAGRGRCAATRTHKRRKAHRNHRRCAAVKRHAAGRPAGAGSNTVLAPAFTGAVAPVSVLPSPQSAAPAAIAPQQAPPTPAPAGEAPVATTGGAEEPASPGPGSEPASTGGQEAPAPTEGTEAPPPAEGGETQAPPPSEETAPEVPAPTEGGETQAPPPAEETAPEAPAPTESSEPEASAETAVQQSTTTTTTTESTHFHFFSSTSFWNEPLASTAPLDPNSGTIVKAFNEVVNKEAPNNQLNINTTAWSVPIYTVPATQPTVKVTLNKGTGSSTNPLQAAWEAVPLPKGAQAAKGTDKHLVVWQPSTDKLWEFFGFEPETETTGPQAQWGGAMQNVSTDPGVYTPLAWPQPSIIKNTEIWEWDVNHWGATASSLAVVGGLITLEDFEKGQINHALAMAVPGPRASTWSSPAHRTDGTSSLLSSLPEGAHLRLDPKLNLANLKLPHVVLMLAEAAQRYGIVIRDKAANITFYAQDPTPTGTNPYTGPEGYFEGKYPCKFLTQFPWSHLQLLKMELHSSTTG